MPEEGVGTMVGVDVSVGGAEVADGGTGVAVGGNAVGTDVAFGPQAANVTSAKQKNEIKTDRIDFFIVVPPFCLSD